MTLSTTSVNHFRTNVFQYLCPYCGEKIFLLNQGREIVEKNLSIPKPLIHIIMQYIICDVATTPCRTFFHLSCHENWIVEKIKLPLCNECKEMTIYSLNDDGEIYRSVSNSLHAFARKQEITFDHIISIYPNAQKNCRAIERQYDYVIRGSTIYQHTEYSFCQRIAARCCRIFCYFLFCCNDIGNDSPDSPIAYISPSGTLRQFF